MKTDVSARTADVCCWSRRSDWNLALFLLEKPPVSQQTESQPKKYQFTLTSVCSSLVLLTGWFNFGFGSFCPQFTLTYKLLKKKPFADVLNDSSSRCFLCPAVWGFVSVCVSSRLEIRWHHCGGRVQTLWSWWRYLSDQYRGVIYWHLKLINVTAGDDDDDHNEPMKGD